MKNTQAKKQKKSKDKTDDRVRCTIKGCRALVKDIEGHIERKHKTGPKGPTKKTTETIKKLEQAFALDATIAEACYYADIDESTYYAWIKEDTELSNRLKALRNKPVLAARQALINQISDKKDGTLALKYLERKKKDEFSPKKEIEHSGNLMISEVLDELEEED